MPSTGQGQGRTTVKQIQSNTQMVACPGSFLGKYHECGYSTHRGIWQCPACGLGGNGDGFALLTRLEAELYRLDTEVKIRDFESRLEMQA